MAVRYVLGRSGSGKTSFFISEMKKEMEKNPLGSPLIMLVPEQGSFEKEKRFLLETGFEATFRGEVMNFNQLIRRLFNESGHIRHEEMGPAGKNIILSRIVSRLIKEKKLGFFTENSPLPGFINSIGEVHSEFKMYGIDGNFREKFSEGDFTAMPSLARKLDDLSLIFSEYEALTGGRYFSRDDYLEKVKEIIPRSRFLKDAVVSADGFFSFTPQERSVLALLAGKVRELSVSLPLDRQSLEGEPDDFMREVRREYDRLDREFADSGCPERGTFFLPEKGRSDRGDLEHLEKNLFIPAGKTFPEKPENIFLLEAEDRRTEVAAIADMVITACRDEGLRYRDICVVFRDIAPYEADLRNVFSDRGIPFFLDVRRPVLNHPLAEMIRSGCGLITEGFPASEAVSFLKTGLTGLTSEEVWDCENYALKKGLRGKKQWTENPGRREDENSAGFGAEDFYILTGRVFAPLLELHRETGGGRKFTAGDFCGSLCSFLEKMEVRERLEKWSAQALAEGCPERAEEHRQVWNIVCDLMEEINRIVGTERMRFSEFASMLSDAMEGIKYGIIPSGMDQVVIADPSRALFPGLKAIFTAGLNEGVFPARPGNMGLLSDSERVFLEEKEVELSPCREEKLYWEEFYLYRSLTAAENRLTVSYALSDGTGASLRPSEAVRRMRRIFPVLPIKQVHPVPEGTAGEIWDYLQHPLPVIGYLGSHIGKGSPDPEKAGIWKSVEKWFEGSPVWSEHLARVREAYQYRNTAKKLPAPVVSSLFAGGTLYGSVSSFEAFRKCPFSYFASYILGLREREIFSLDVPDIGNIFHAVLEKAGKASLDNGVPWREMEEEVFLEVLRQEGEKTLQGFRGGIMSSSDRYRHFGERFLRELLLSGKYLYRQHAAGSFSLRSVEEKFRERETGIPVSGAVSVGAGLTLVITGYIDRTDICRQDGRTYFRIIDYKSGNPNNYRLDKGDIWLGTSLQLPVYMEMTRRMLEADGKDAETVIAAGMHYFYIRNPVIESSGPLDDGELEKKRAGKFVMGGGWPADLNILLLTDGGITENEGYSGVTAAKLNKRGRERLTEIMEEGNRTAFSGEAFPEGDGEFFQKNSAGMFTPGEMRKSGEYSMDKLREIAGRIFAGETAITPLQRDNRRPCSYCRYRDVCQFDNIINHNDVEKCRMQEARQKAEAVLKGGGRNDGMDS